MVEYALVAGFLAVIAVAVMPQFSTTVSTLYSTVGRTINEALSAMGS